MSGKMLFLLAAIGGGAYAVSRAEPPVPPGTTAADSIAYADISFGERFQYSMGSVGVAIFGGSIRKSVMETEQNLAELKGALKSAKGPDGVRARAAAKKIIFIDSVAVDNLHYGRPIKAMKQSMEARNLLNMVKRQLQQGV